MMEIPTLQTGWVVGAIFHADADGPDPDLAAEPLALFTTLDEPPVEPPPGSTFQTVVLMPDPTYPGLYLMGA